MRANIIAGAAVLVAVLSGCAHDPKTAEQRADYMLYPAHSEYTAADAERMIRASQTVLAPVYAPLAEQIVGDFDLEDRQGIGIDIGSGPGDLIVELAARSGLHWVNADINPYFFGHFLDLAEDRGVAHRVSAIFADVHALPLRDGYGDVVVSRGSFHFWQDQERAFSEILRVLKPGGVAFIGRGLPRDLPLEVARSVRARQGGSMRYDLGETERQLRATMRALGINDYSIERPRAPGGVDVNYGIWLTFRKP